MFTYCRTCHSSNRDTAYLKSAITLPRKRHFAGARSGGETLRASLLFHRPTLPGKFGGTNGEVA